MPFYQAALLYLAVLTPFAHVQADSTLFSQIIGATTASGPSLGDLALAFMECTNALHGFPALTSLSPSESTQLEPEAVDVVCQACTNLGQSRIDSCCAYATSSACFDQFAASNVVQTTAASVSTFPTATSAGGSSSTASSSSNGVIIAQNRNLFAGSFVAVMFGFPGWML